MRSPLALLLLPALAAPLTAQDSPTWRVHDMARPRPAAAAAVPAARFDAPPPGAVVLFDGTSLKHWVGSDGQPAKWTLGKGYFEVKPGTGTIMTVDSFGDMQLHLEWSEPVPATGEGQDRGNSGVFLMGRYELQVLDSWHNDTYADGQVGSLYGQHPPLFNAALPPGTWQRYDVFFRRPRFGADGRLVSPARVTVLQNGVPVQNNAVIFGPTSWLTRNGYSAHPDKLPIGLQDHSFKVRFRNIWVRPLPEEQPAPPPPAVRATTPEERTALVGKYKTNWGEATVADSAGGLWLDMGDGPMALEADGPDAWSITGVDAGVSFPHDTAGKVSGLVVVVGGENYRYTRAE